MYSLGALSALQGYLRKTYKTFHVSARQELDVAFQGSRGDCGALDRIDRTYGMVS